MASLGVKAVIAFRATIDMFVEHFIWEPDCIFFLFTPTQYVCKYTLHRSQMLSCTDSKIYS